MTFDVTDTGDPYIEDIADEELTCPECGDTALGVSVETLVDEYDWDEDSHGITVVDIRQVPTRKSNVPVCYPTNCKYHHYIHP